MMFSFDFYDETKEQLWDELVEKDSANGTFLQTRRFMNYHPEGRFNDCSLMIYYKATKLAAVCPANQYMDEDGEQVFFSYQGATFGGLVIARKYYKAKYVIPLVEELKYFLRERDYQKLYIKTTPDIFSVQSSSLLEYACYKAGFDDYKELNTYINYKEYGLDILSNLTQGKRTNVHNCEKMGLMIKQINSEDEIAEYYEILCENLEKYGRRPVHSLNELMELKKHRLREETEFFGVYLEDRMIAGGLLFYFERTKMAHTQYLAHVKEYLKLSPMTYLYYWLIQEMRKRGYNGLSWGIATEDHGMTLNEGLITSKENYGSTYSNNHTFYIEL